jgi:acetyl esterase/lipase
VQRQRFVAVIAGILTLLGATAAWTADSAAFTRASDLIYLKKDGLAFTYDVFAPKENANGAAVVVMVSGGFFSRHDMINPAICDEFIKRGYTVFAVVHGSQPRFTIPEIIDQVNRGVRHIRSHAEDYHIDASRIGVTGASAGGHLSLMLGTAGKDGAANAADPVERASSRVQAVACFFPPTDFMNFGGPGKEHIGDVIGIQFRAAFDFREFDKSTGRFQRITDMEKIRAITRDISPASHVTANSAPTFIIHGDKDGLVPIQQSELIMTKFKEAGVPAELIVKKGADHGWLDILKDVSKFADWFDKYLAKPNGGK